MTTSAYPLQWPATRQRTKAPRDGAFNKKINNGRYIETKNLSVSDALSRLQHEVDRLGARQYVLSSNLETRLDGLPRSGQAEPKDSGVALYFHIGDKPHCLPCDTYNRVADNIAAIAKHIEATRAIERYGVATISEMFSGFVALPPPGAKLSWREVLGFAPQQFPTKSVLETAFRAAARRAHPDAGGTDAQMEEVLSARAEAYKELGGA